MELYLSGITSCKVLGGNGVTREAEESPLLRSVTGKRLVKAD
jgi:hypothetical protein